jgi:hypothetical protein
MENSIVPVGIYLCVFKKLKVIKFQIKGWIYFIAHTVRLVPYFVDSEFGLREKIVAG